MRAWRGSALAALGLIAACGAPTVVERETLSVFGGQAEIELHASDAARARAALTEVSERFQAMDRDWHAFKPGALVDLNTALARGEAQPTPASIRDLIRRSQALSIRSDGLFDPAVGQLMQLWGFHTETFPIRSPLPTREEIDAWRATRASIADVVVEGERVSSRNRAVQLDFGGVTEGVAAEVATTILAAHGVTHALLTLGGDYYALVDDSAEPWPVTMRDPYGGVLAEIELGDHEALFISGNYNKFRDTPSGARWAHVLDPRSGQPVRGSAAVAVLNRDPVLADVAATTLMVGGVARFADLVAQLGIRCAVLVTEENEMILTAGMDARLRLQREPVRLGPPLGSAGPCTP
jgi:thiamine biosynthesis lipoprotein